MQRVSGLEGTNYFVHQDKNREKQLIRAMYRQIDDTHWAIGDWNSHLRRLCRTPENKFNANFFCWRALMDAIDTLSRLQRLCSICDPDSAGAYYDDTNFSWDIDQLFQFHLELRSKANFIIKQRNLVSTPDKMGLTRLSDDEEEFVKGVNEIHKRALDRVLSLCKSIFGTFCQMCHGDELFSNTQKEFNKRVVQEWEKFHA